MDKNLVGKYGVGRWFLFLLLIILLIVSFFPLAWMFFGAFKTNNEIYQTPLALPKSYDFSVFPEAWEKASFGIALYNSFFIAIITVVAILIFSSMAAYAFAMMQFRFKNVLYLVVLAGQMISAQIILIPLFSLFKGMSLLNNRWSAIFAYTAIGIPLSVLLLRNSFQEVPKDIYESAKIDGCNSFRFYLQFMLPLSKPGISTVIIYQALFAWNEYIFALTFLNSNDVKTIPLSLTVFVGRYASDWPKIFSILTLSVLPLMILYLILQKYFIRGLPAGAVKG